MSVLFVAMKMGIGSRVHRRKMGNMGIGSRVRRVCPRYMQSGIWLVVDLEGGRTRRLNSFDDYPVLVSLSTYAPLGARHLTILARHFPAPLITGGSSWRQTQQSA